MFLEDQETGYRVRQWKAAELRSFTQADIAHALCRCRVVEVPQLLGDIPISAIKNAIYKGWIVKDVIAPFYHVTRLAQMELGLPKKDRNGCTIRFLDNGLARGEPSIAKLDRELAPMLPKVPFTARPAEWRACQRGRAGSVRKTRGIANEGELARCVPGASSAHLASAPASV